MLRRGGDLRSSYQGNMRFVATKTPEQQSGLTLHRTRHLFIRRRLRDQCDPGSSHRVRDRRSGRPQRCEELLNVVTDASDKTSSPRLARMCLAALGVNCAGSGSRLRLDRMIMAWHRSHEASRRLDAIPGVGPILATALVASVNDPKAFRSGRNFWPGLVWCQAALKRG